MWKAQAAPSVAAPKETVSREEGLKKVKKTIGWYNNHGSLQQPIIYKTVKEAVEKMEPRKALRLLKSLEEKAATIPNPTFWLLKAAENAPDLDEKVRKTIGWYNNHGGLQEHIDYPEVCGELAKISIDAQLSILSQLQDKADTIKNPTGWICRAAQKQAGKGSSGKGKYRTAQPDDLDAQSLIQATPKSASVCANPVPTSARPRPSSAWGLKSGR
eukprot:TRINITY_DN1332_c0_g3_i1.p1 TRINITY_DN1332_c0_g3~~TRINITY_DN1332_c0_g3_i1.p1  ORF type:complete len:215 (+),score=46.62 TRINITY_DN1332_c0_g3_i1:82-726(+)